MHIALQSMQQISREALEMSINWIHGHWQLPMVASRVKLPNK